MDFTIHTKVFFGENALNALKTIKFSNAFIVTDPYMVQSKTVNILTDILDEMKVPYQIFQNVVPDPPINIIAEGIIEYFKEFPDAVIALGGGSAIDTAKAISEFSLRLSKNRNKHCIAIPTTSGTGSEVTSFSVISDKENNIKYPLVSDSMLPDIAILDPNLVVSVPKNVTADTGMDVLTHAIEAYVSTKANDFSDALAEKAIKLVFDYLPFAYSNGKDILAREKIHNASCLAGMSFNNTSLGLNHGLAHAIGGQFKISHGRINSILLPHIIKYNAGIRNQSNEVYSKTAIKYANIARIINIPFLTVAEAIDKLILRICSLQEIMDMPSTLTDLSILEEDIISKTDDIATNALNDSTTETNPRIPTKKDIIDLINCII